MADAPDDKSPATTEATDAIEARLTTIEGFEPRIGLPKGAVRKLLREKTDWEFVIQLACILEATLTEVLVRHLHNEKLQQHVVGLTQSRRIALAMQTDCISENEQRALTALAEIRNKFVHSTKNLSVTLQEYGQQLTAEARVALLSALVPWVVPAQWFPDSGTERFGKSLRFLLWIGAIFVLGELMLKDAAADIKKLQRELAEMLSQNQFNTGLLAPIPFFRAEAALRSTGAEKSPK